jgi:PAS domain S-box-containing protein
MKASTEKRDKMNNVVAHVEDIVTKLDKVSKELMPNGGGSIKDQVKQISEDIKTIMIERDATFYLSKEPMFKSDGNGYYSSVNHAMCQLCGVSENELLGLGWLNYIALEDKDRIWEEWENIIESGKEISLFYGIKNPTTMEVIPVKCRAVINRDNDKILSVIGTIEPTEKKHYKKLKIA